MNDERITDMEQSLRTLETLNADQREWFYDRLIEKGFSTSDVENIKALLFYRRLHSDPQLYDAVRDAVCNALSTSERGDTEQN